MAEVVDSECTCSGNVLIHSLSLAISKTLGTTYGRTELSILLALQLLY